MSQKDKAQRFFELHHSSKMLVLPNIWDPFGALMLESLGYPAIATASASIAYSNGYMDGQHIPFNDLLKILKKIAGSVEIPVSADFESGYADNNKQLRENIRMLLGTGVVGINIEDSDIKANVLLTAEAQCERIRIIRQVADEMGIHLFINARTDVYLRGTYNPFEETLKRGHAYKQAGADCFFPVLMKDQEEIQKLVQHLKMPVNIVVQPGIPDLQSLAGIGVARVSVGPSLFKIAVRAIKELVIDLKDLKGLQKILENDVTSDYLKNLVNRNFEKA